MIINQNQKPEELKRSNKIRKIINDGINLNFSKTNDLIQKYGNNSKQIKKINYTKYITKGNNYYFSKYLELRNIDVLCNFCSIKDQCFLIDLNLELNNDNELIKHFDKNFAIFLLENKFPFSKKFKEMHNYNYINDSKYSTICLDEIKCGQKSKDKSNEVKIFPNLNELDNLTDNNKNNDNNNNSFYNESANFHSLKKKSQLIQEDLNVEKINSDLLENIGKKRLLNKETNEINFSFDVDTGESTNYKNYNNDNINFYNCYEDLQINNLIFEEKNEEYFFN
jgi:hypothetical protein